MLLQDLLKRKVIKINGRKKKYILVVIIRVVMEEVEAEAKVKIETRIKKLNIIEEVHLLILLQIIDL